MATRSRIFGSAFALASLAGVAMVAVNCGDDASSSGADPCPGGICTTTGPGSGGSGGSTGPGGPGSGGSGGGGTTCVWVCSPWDTQGNGNDATRTCVNVDGCAEGDKPIEAITLPALDENYYRCNVEPIMDRLCSQLACHGVEPDLAAGDPGRALRIYHRGRMRITGEMLASNCPSGGTRPSEECIGSIECACWQNPHTATEWQRNFDAARGFALDPITGIQLSDMTLSEMVTQPDNAVGLAHANIKIWDSENTGSPTYGDYQTLLDWLNGGTMTMCGSQN